MLWGCCGDVVVMLWGCCGDVVGMCGDIVVMSGFLDTEKCYVMFFFATEKHMSSFENMFSCVHVLDVWLLLVCRFVQQA